MLADGEMEPRGSHRGVSCGLGLGQGKALHFCLLTLGVKGLLDQVLGGVPRTCRTYVSSRELRDQVLPLTSWRKDTFILL